MSAIRARLFHDWKVKQLACREYIRSEGQRYSGIRHRQRGFIINPYVYAATGGDPYWANVRLLLHMDGTNGGSTFTDSSSYANSVTRSGVTTSTSQIKYGSASLYMNASASSTNWLSVADTTNLELGASDFCIESWIYYIGAPATGPATPVISSKVTSISSGIEHIYALFGGASSTATQYFYWSTDGTTLQNVNGGSFTPGTGAWNHVAVSREGTSLKFWWNGAQQGSTGTLSGTIYSGTAAWLNMKYGGATATFNGHLDDLRITIGNARYTAAFTPPTAAHPDF